MIRLLCRILSFKILFLSLTIEKIFYFIFAFERELARSKDMLDQGLHRETVIQIDIKFRFHNLACKFRLEDKPFNSAVECRHGKRKSSVQVR